MKHLTIILLLALTVSLHGQKSSWEKWSRPVGISLYHIGTVVLGSLGDAYNDNGNKPLGHTLKALEVGALISGPMIWKIRKGEFAPYIATYIGWRTVGYDYVYNAGRNLPWDYLGGSGNWDKTLRKFPSHGVTFMRGIVLVATISIPIRYF